MSGPNTVNIAKPSPSFTVTLFTVILGIVHSLSIIETTDVPSRIAAFVASDKTILKLSEASAILSSRIVIGMVLVVSFGPNVIVPVAVV